MPIAGVDEVVYQAAEIGDGGLGVGHCRVQGSGFRVQGSGFRVQGSGFRVQGSGLAILRFLPLDD